MSVTNEQLGKLLPFSISICHWCREQEPWVAAESFLKPYGSKTKEGVENCLDQVLKSIELTEFELTNAQVRYILNQYSVEIWMQVLKHIVRNANSPSILSIPIRKNLVDLTIHFLKTGAQNWNELLIEVFRILSDGMSLTAFNVLGEFLSLVRNCSQQAGFDVVSSEIAADLLLTSRKEKKARQNAASQLLAKMVQEASSLFGQPAVFGGLSSFGIRSRVEQTQWNLVHFLPPEKKAMQDLKTFYSFLDRKFIPVVENLFEYHSFITLAEAINIKYGMIPAAWKSTLNNMKKNKTKGLKWFVYANIRTPTPGAKGQPDAGQSMMIVKPTQEARPTKEDLLVNSFIDGEVTFYRRLSYLGKGYVRLLLEISSNPRDPRAQALGLSRQEIDQVFGKRFQKILDATHGLLTNLEVINLSRKKVTKGTREQVLAETVREFAKSDMVKAYALYSKTYPEVALILKKKAEAKLQKKRGSKRAAHPDFFDIWMNVRGQLHSLEQKRLEEVMELPVRRIHVYREIIKQLLAGCQNQSTTPKYRDLYNAYTSLRAAAESLTSFSEQYAKQMGSFTTVT